MTSEQSLVARRREEASEWCILHADGDLDGENRRRFADWIADKENEKALKEAARIWQAMGQAAEWPEVIHIRATALQSYGEANSSRWSVRTTRRWGWLGAVAAAILVIVTTVSLLHRGHDVYTTGVGEHRVAMLADGSRLTLDADSEVDVRQRAGSRELTLVRGRARFDVARDPARPFVVYAGQRAVLATGTQFSVELVDRSVHVVLIEGHVAVLDKAQAKDPSSFVREGRPVAPKDGYQLTAGTELIEPASGPAPRSSAQPVDVDRVLSWQSGQLVFEDTDLRTAVEQVNRYSTTKVRLTDEAASGARVSGVFKQGDTAAFVEAVSALDGLRLISEEGEITLTTASRRPASGK